MNTERPGLIRSLAHRLAGDSPRLPNEGQLAPFDGATAWVNSEPLTLEALGGRVVLVDFLTYTCVNWLRTLPYVRAWASKYRDAGLTVVGVHTPEFGFEQNLENVGTQLRNLKVEFPVAVDNDYAVWSAFANHYWPAVYLADAEGRIRYHHFGEGEYAQTEMAIQQLLSDAGSQEFDRNLVMVEPKGLEVAADWQTLGSPETYLGYGQSSGFWSEDRSTFDRAHAYGGEPPQLPLNNWDLAGTWTVAKHAAILNEPRGRIAFQFHARDVNLVMGPLVAGTEIPFRVFLDGQGVGTGTLRDQNTYQLVRAPGPVADRLFEIEFLEAGVEAYCFTFG